MVREKINSMTGKLRWHDPTARNEDCPLSVSSSWWWRQLSLSSIHGFFRDSTSSISYVYQNHSAAFSSYLYVFSNNFQGKSSARSSLRSLSSFSTCSVHLFSPSPSNQSHSVLYLLNFFCIALIVVVVIIIIAVYSSSSAQFIHRRPHHLRPRQWRPISSSHPSTAFRGSFSARGRPCLERMLFRRRQRQECRRGWKWTCAWRWTGKGFFGWSSWIVCLLWSLKREQFRHTWTL